MYKCAIFRCFYVVVFLQIFEGQKVRYYVLFLLVLPGGTAAYHNGHVPEGDAGGHCPSSISCSADPEHLLWQDLRDGSICAQKVDNAGQFTLG